MRSSSPLGSDGGGRARRAGLTSAAVVDAALRVADRDGLNGLTMRRVGAELGVEAMSLYHHVASKDALLDAMAELIIAGVELPPADLGWDERLRWIARGLRAQVLAHPRLAPLVATRPLQARQALVPVDATLAALLAAGLAPPAAVSAFWALSSYVVGALLAEAAATVEQRPLAIGPAALGEGVDGAQPLPTIAQLAPLLATSDYEREFERGLEVLIDAVAAGFRAGR